MKSDFRLVFAGTPTFAAKALEALLNEGFNIVAAYTQPDRPAGRGMKLSPSAVKQLALERGIRVLQPSTLKTPDARAELAALKPDLMIVAAYGLILPQAVLDTPRLGCLNIHASLLPRWRGAAPIQRALLAGDAETGVCIMRMEAGLDTGAVLREVRTPITELDTAGTLLDRLADLGSRACVAVVEQLAHGETIPEAPQPDIGVTYAQKITPDEARIDWSRPAAEILRAVRAFNPVPGAWTTWRGEKLKIWSAQLAGDTAPAAASTPLAPWQNAAAGTIVRTGRSLHVVCGSDQTKQLLTLHETQVAGAKRMLVSTWCSGTNCPGDGDRLGEV